MNGGWAPFGPYGKCVRKNKRCDRSRKRECANGGAKCIGSQYQSVQCGAKSCGKLLYLKWFRIEYSYNKTNYSVNMIILL